MTSLNRAKPTRPATAGAAPRGRQRHMARASAGDGAADGGADGATVAAARARASGRRFRRSRNSQAPSTISTGPLPLLRPSRPRLRSPRANRGPCRSKSRAAMCSRRLRRGRRRRHRRRSPTQPFPNRRPPNRRAGVRPYASPRRRRCAMRQVRPRRPSRRPCRRSSPWRRAQRRAMTAIGRAVPAGGASVCSARADRALLSIRGRPVGARPRRLARA